jgi:hypothetical protein
MQCKHNPNIRGYLFSNRSILNGGRTKEEKGRRKERVRGRENKRKFQKGQQIMTKQ